jgi:16S rRNA (uracil1498-N3)-methyltransferase
VTTLLVTPERFAAERLSVEGDSYRHLVKARRLESGDRLRVVDGGGRARWAYLEGVGRRSAELVLGDPAPANEPRARVELWAAPPRAPRASWMVEKLTELGVSAVRFFRTERAPRSYGDGTLERMVRVAGSAVEQSGRSRLPEVTGVHGWAEALELLAGADRRWLLQPGAEPVRPAAAEGATTVVLVGPEGGFTEAESTALEALPASSVGLGPTILRVETAAIVAVARALLP